ncbi:MAG: flavodoxin-dependent (E)-4-hydroxy-3-methylbut-2-enyl-diphosphate synthase [Coriobacteriaceae bacterium]
MAVQSMLNVAADDAAANLADRGAGRAGCEIVRMAIPRRDCLDAFEAVCAASPLPVVAASLRRRIAIEAAPWAASCASTWQHRRPGSHSRGHRRGRLASPSASA